MTRRTHSRGSAMLEFTLVGIPLVFTLISVFEMARGMWLYHTLAYAVKDATRFAVVHGSTCGPPNACTITVNDVARRIPQVGIGLDPAVLQVTLTSAKGTVTCNPVSSCFGNATTWPPAGGNTAPQDITIKAVYPFQSAIAMFWPGAGTPVNFAVFRMPAASTESIQF